jgi:hypothetical protein
MCAAGWLACCRFPGDKDPESDELFEAAETHGKKRLARKYGVEACEASMRCGAAVVFT